MIGLRRGSWIALTVATLALLLLVGRSVTALVVDRAWFAALNAEQVFWEQLIDSMALRGGLWLLGGLFAFVNLHAVRRTILEVVVPTSVANIEMTAMLPARRLLAFTIIASALVGLVLTLPFNDWTSLALVRHGISFNEREHFFSRDLGFYVYWLPFEESMYVWALLAVVVMIAIVVVLYVLTRSVRLDNRRIVSSNYARRHLTVLGVLVMLLLAWSYRLDGYDLLRYGSGPDGLFMSVDHIVTLKIDFALGLLAFLASVVLLRAGWVGQVRTASITLTTVLLAALAVRHGLPLLMASGSTLGNPVRREVDYVGTRAIYTRHAYDVDGMATLTADSGRTIAPVHLANLSRTLTVWDAGPLTKALGPLNDARSQVVPVAWTPNDGEIRGLLLQRPSNASGAWTLISVNGSDVDDRGAPVHDGTDVAGSVDSASMIVADDVAAGSIAEPLIAPMASGHRLVVDSATRIVGARLETLGSRVAHAWATRDPRLLSANDSGASPTLVTWRDVRERVRRLAPVFEQGQDVVPLLHDGTLYWAVELYSASATYPLSQRWQLAGDTRSYFRHAATALVDSRTGRVRLVTVTAPDPVARTWMALAPGLFVPVRKLSSSLAMLLPPPTDGVIAQVRSFARYGSLVDGSASRHLPDSVLGADSPAGILFSGKAPSVGWSVPLLDASDQIAGIAFATGGAERGAKWMALPNSTTRWGVLADRLRTGLESSRSALAEGGKREPFVTYGRIRTVLVDGAPVLMQPMYVTRLNGTQALARVAVLSGASVAVGVSTADAVRKLQGPSATHGNGALTSNVPLSATGRQAIVLRLYETMRAAMKRGDWARFGAAFDSLGFYVGKPPQ